MHVKDTVLPDSAQRLKKKYSTSQFGSARIQYKNERMYFMKMCGLFQC